MQACARVGSRHDRLMQTYDVMRFDINIFPLIRQMPGPPPHAGIPPMGKLFLSFNHRGNFPVRRLRETSSFGQGRGAFESINLRCRRFYFTRSLVTRRRSFSSAYADFLLLFAKRTDWERTTLGLTSARSPFSLSLSFEQTSPFIRESPKSLENLFRLKPPKRPRRIIRFN